MTRGVEGTNGVAAHMLTPLLSDAGAWAHVIGYT